MWRWLGKGNKLRNTHIKGMANRHAFNYAYCIDKCKFSRQRERLFLYQKIKQANTIPSLANVKAAEK
jgi:hypothetical protein